MAAVVGVGAGVLIPQRKSGSGNGLATSSLIRIMAHSAVELMRSQEIKFVRTNATPPQTTKLVLSGYSDSGVSLWSSGWTNADHVKAVIAVEPQNLNALTNADISGVNKRGIDLLAKFTTEDQKLPDLEKRKFILVGRHRTHYAPQLGTASITEAQAAGTLVRLPDTRIHDSIFDYPPKDDPSVPPFVRYRTYRLFHPSEEPLISATERTQLDALLAGKSSTAAAAALFPASFNQDGGSGNWYSHNFAANGGQIFTLPPKHATNSYYGVAVTYKTFFQEGLEIALP